jgi:hypothetical protein
LYKDGSEPPNAEADGLDFIRIDKLVSVCKFFTKKKMAVLRALDTTKFDNSSPMAKDYGRAMCEEVNHRRALTAWQSLRALRVRLSEQGE